MTNDRDRRSAYGTVGSEDATRPSEAEDPRAEPMAVANDKTTVHGKSHLPSTASLDQFDADVARRYQQVPDQNGGAPLGKMVTESREENRRMEDPPEYEIEKETGWKKLKAFESEGPGEEGRTARIKEQSSPEEE